MNNILCLLNRNFQPPLKVLLKGFSQTNLVERS
jgi:hypothetical protein